MQSSFEQQLLNQYAHLFPQEHQFPGSEFPLGIGCSDGWFPILDALLLVIDTHQKFIEQRNLQYTTLSEQIKNGEDVPSWARERFNQNKLTPTFFQPVKISQIKEKFGTLRFYYQGGDACIDGAVQMAEAMSAKTCEQCGSQGSLRTDLGWIRTLCDTHYTQYKQERLNQK